MSIVRKINQTIDAIVNLTFIGWVGIVIYIGHQMWVDAPTGFQHFLTLFFGIIAILTGVLVLKVIRTIFSAIDAVDDVINK